MGWQVQEAKQKLSEVIQRAIDEGPQIVTRHGQEVAVVISIDEYRRLTGERQDLKSLLLAAPDFELLDLERSKDLPREVSLP